MKQEWICPQGHHWESLVGADHDPSCPACGQAGTTIHAAEESYTRVMRDEFPPLPRQSPQLAMPSVESPSIGTLPNLRPKVEGFELQEELGRGGMGVVYRALQQPLKRPVALKMLLSGEFASPEERHRFLREGQSLAQLQHPHIVQVYLIGEHDERAYLCMELVDGPSLAMVAAGHPLPWSVAGKLLEQLADAVGAAHEQGIVHRDLKPANILLQGGRNLNALNRGDENAWKNVVAKITDFGLAKSCGESGGTRSGTVMGTPNYMAPEQAQGRVGEIGPATDVYALGAILYELLTGRPPYLGANSAETIHCIISQDPIPPRVLQPRVPRDLETICLRALERNPLRRYVSAIRLAQDLKRYREGIPILARRVTWIERSWKWAQRRPAAAGLLAVSGVALVSFLGLWAYFTVALQAKRVEADAARGREKQQRTIADANFQRAREAVDDFLVRISQETLLREPGMQPLRRDLLRSAQTYYEQFLQERGLDENLRRETALTHGRLGLILRELGEPDQANAAYKKALSLYEQMWNEQHDAAIAPRLAETYHDLALLHREAGRVQDAIALYRHALVLDEQAVKASPKDVDRLRGMAKTLSNLGVAAMAVGSSVEALDWGTRACEILASVAEQSQQPEDRLNWARGLINLAQAQSDEPAAELASCETAERILGELVARDPQFQEYRVQHAKCLHNLGILYSQKGEANESRVALSRAIELNRQLVQENSQVPEFRQQLATGLYVTAVLELDAKALNEAEEHLREALSELQILLQESPKNPALLSLAGLLAHQSGLRFVALGDERGAIPQFEQAIERQTEAIELAPDAAAYRHFLASHRAALEKVRPIP
jgi:eukaryotic-like serine/threonine-protein kinase